MSGTSIGDRVADAVSRLRGQPGRQLELPFEVDTTRSNVVLRKAREFGTSFAPKLGSSLLMRVGVPMVGATTPLALQLINPDWTDDMAPNLLTGSMLGGLWGAAVGATIPRTSDGIRISRLRAAGGGAASGILLAPAVAAVAKFVTEDAASRITDPIQKRLDTVKEQRDTALEQAQQP